VAIVVRAAARHDLEARHAREPAAYFVRDPVGEVAVGRVAEILERQHREPFRAGVLLAPPCERRQANRTPSPIAKPSAKVRAATGTGRRGRAGAGVGTVGAGGGGAGVVKVRFGGVITVGVAVGVVTGT